MLVTFHQLHLTGLSFSFAEAIAIQNSLGLAKGKGLIGGKF